MAVFSDLNNSKKTVIEFPKAGRVSIAIAQSTEFVYKSSKAAIQKMRPLGCCHGYFGLKYCEQ
jgi:hypothetical protein